MTELYWTAYSTWEPFRYTMISLQRCSVIGQAVVLDAIDYKRYGGALPQQIMSLDQVLKFYRTFNRKYDSLEAERKALSECHLRSANRMLQALLKNGGIFVKLGQHVSSLCVRHSITWSMLEADS